MSGAEGGPRPDAGSASTATAIHDIGYRHYRGPRLGRGYAIRSLFSHSLRGAFGLGRPGKSKIIPFFLLAVMCAPAIVQIAIKGIVGADITIVTYARYVSRMQVASAIFLAAQTPVVISRDLRFHTVPLYFSRPLGWFDYVLAKLTALFAAMFALFAIPMIILFAGQLLNKENAWHELQHLAPALGGAVVYALTLAALGAAISACTPRRGFGVAAIIAVYLISYGAVSTLQAFLIFNQHTHAAGYLNLFSPFTLVSGFQEWALRTPHMGLVGTMPGGVSLIGVLVVLLGSFGLLATRYRKAGLA